MLTVGVSLWWIVGLRTQGTYGLPILQLTESVRTVATDSTPTDVLRGIGNWFFYGKDRLGYSIDQASAYAGNFIVQTASYAIPIAALGAAAIIRWRHRAYFVLLVIVGTVVSVGAWPYDNPSPYGGVFKTFADTAAGLALRNTPRAVPLIVLGLAGLLAAGVAALAPRFGQLVPDAGRRHPGVRGVDPGVDDGVPLAASRPRQRRSGVLEGRHRRDAARRRLDARAGDSRQ